MIELQKFVYGKLKEIHDRTYLEVAPEGTAYPVVIYRFPDSDYNEWREDFTLEIDVWDVPADNSSVVVQNLSDQIDQSLNRLIFLSEDGSWCTRIYRINRLMVPDPDPRIKRRQLRYELRTYRRDG